MIGLPHLALSMRGFYRSKLKPLLAKWAMVFFADKKMGGVADDMLLSYLMDGNRSRPEVTNACRSKLNDEQFKMLNLTHDWLESFMPHVLSKLNRVHFGLLTPRDLRRALALDPNMPEARRL